MSIKGSCVCIFKKLFNTKMKFFAKHLPDFSKCKPSWYKSILKIFPLSVRIIPFFLHISTIC